MKAVISVRASLDRWEAVRQALTEALDSLDVPGEVESEMILLAEEVFTNSAKYGRPKDRELTFQIFSRVVAGRLQIRFSDDGEAFDPLGAAEPDLDLPNDERPIGGLGVHLIRELSDHAAYRREEGLNVLTVERKLTP